MVTATTKPESSPDVSEFIAHLADAYANSESFHPANDTKYLQSFDKTFGEYKAGYFGGGVSRFLPQPPGTNSLGANADSHYSTESEYFRMVERSRYFDRDNMIFSSGLNKVNANILQNGFMLQVMTGDDDLDDDLFAGWEEYSKAENFDFEQEKDFDQATDLVLRSIERDGDVFGIPTTRNGRIELVENHHCRNPFGVQNRSFGTRKKKTGIVHGVEINDGRRVAYHMTPDIVGVGQHSQRYNTRPYAARTPSGHKQVWQCYFPKRISQRRGVGIAAPIVFPLHYNDELQFAAMVNAKKQSFIAILRELDAAGGLLAGSQRTSGTRQELSGERKKLLKDGSPGQEYVGIPGEKLKGFAATVPAPSHFAHTELLMTLCAINMDLPLMVFLLDASKTNFNGYRGAIDQARQRYKIIQRDLISQWHRQVYMFYVRWRLFRDPRLKSLVNRLSNINVFKHRWTPQGWDYVQPVQDAAADELQLSANLTSPRRRARKRGIEWSELSQEIVEDRSQHIRRSIEAANEINEQFKDQNVNVNWREIAFGQDSKVKVNLTGNADGVEPTEPNQASQPNQEPSNGNNEYTA